MEREGAERWLGIGRSVGGRDGSYHMGKCKGKETEKVLETSQLTRYTPKPHEAFSKGVRDSLRLLLQVFFGGMGQRVRSGTCGTNLWVRARLAH